eukprot:6458929-Amphidinium_carterae.1
MHASEIAVPEIVRSEAKQPIVHRGAIKKWPARHLLRAVLASAEDRSLTELAVSLKRKIAFALPDEAGGIFEALAEQGFMVPNKDALCRARIFLDIASIGYARDCNLRRRTTWRQLNYDSSPKGGLEIFGLREFVVEQGDIAKASHTTWPLLSLGFGHATASDKTACLCHLLWLQAGPSALQMRHLAASVFTILTDQGVEASVADSRDCIDEYLLNQSLEDVDIANLDKQFLFPNALPVLDISHLFDWVLRYTCERLPFYKEFLV